MFVQNISVLRETRTSNNVTVMCCYKLERPAGPRGSAIWAEHNWKVRLSLSFNVFPQSFYHVVLYSLPLYARVFFSWKWQPGKPLWWSWHFGVSNVEVESLLIRTKCQFVDITWLRLLPRYEKQPPNEVEWNYTTHQVIAHSDQGLNGNMIGTANQVYLAD